MNEDLNVYELDIDAVMSDLESVLTDRGYDVREQVPAGVWWFKTDKSASETSGEIGRLVHELVTRRLRSVEQ
jgi:hypothetical protein